MENDKETNSSEAVISFDKYEEKTPSFNYTMNNPSTVDKCETRNEPSQFTASYYKEDIEHIDELLRKYHTEDEPDVESDVEDEEQTGLHNQIYESQQYTEGSKNNSPFEIVEEVQPSEELDTNVHGERRETLTLDFESLTEKEVTNENSYTDNDIPFLKEDINANSTKEPIFQDYYRDQVSQWQHDLNEESSTLHIFQVPNNNDDTYIHEDTMFSNQENILPEPIDIPEEIITSEISQSQICDSKLDFVREESIKSIPSTYSIRLSSVRDQIDLYAKWYQNLKDAFAPISCSYCKHTCT